MRITFHVKDYTVTIMIKKRRNRHPRQVTVSIFET